jgi:ribosome biogenesis protein MAK21
MKAVVVREVRQLIYRPGLSMRTVYNGIIFLSQVSLVEGDHEVAAQLVEAYMSLFEKAIKQNELKSRLLAVLLQGIDKSFPFLKNKGSVTKHADSLFRLIHSESFATSTRALVLVSHVALAEAANITAANEANKTQNKKPTQPSADKEDSGDGSNIVNRFYRALYSSLLSPQVTTRSQNTLFFNLVFRSMKRDPSDVR